MNFKNTTVELRVAFCLQALRKAWCKMQKSKQKKVRRKTLIFSTGLGASSLLWRLHMLILRTDSKQIQNCRASPCLFQGNNIFKIFEGAGGFQSLSIQRATAKLPWAHECGLGFLRIPQPRCAQLAAGAEQPPTLQVSGPVHQTWQPQEPPEETLSPFQRIKLPVALQK